MNKYFYEIKPLMMIAVGCLALWRSPMAPEVLYTSGGVLIALGTWIFFQRLKYRGYFTPTQKNNDD